MGLVCKFKTSHFFLVQGKQARVSIKPETELADIEGIPLSGVDGIVHDVQGKLARVLIKLLTIAWLFATSGWAKQVITYINLNKPDPD